MSFQVRGANAIFPSWPVAGGWDGLESFANGSQADLAPSPGPQELPQAVELNLNAVRAALIELGVTADDDNVELAQAFAKLGVPLTEANVSEGRAAMARDQSLPVESFAMAKMLDVVATPAILRAISTVIEGIPRGSELTEPVLSLLNIAPNAAYESGVIAGYLMSVISRLGRSTENALLDQPEEFLDALHQDLRASMLRLALSSDSRNIRLSADMFASFVEGQQLLNQVALSRFDPPVPMYFAFPLLMGGSSPVMAEIQVWTKDKDRQASKRERDKTLLRVVLRICPDRLGQVELRLLGMESGALTCSVAVALETTRRLIRKESEDLRHGLSSAGWNPVSINVEKRATFVPLWYGGAALRNPRVRLDRQV